eukprot:COSAG06_NODE_23043_length_704_cov_1.090909_1_plen_56_part_10
MSSVSLASAASSTASGGSSFRRTREAVTFMLEKEARGFGMIIDEECKVDSFKGEAT